MNITHCQFGVNMYKCFGDNYYLYSFNYILHVKYGLASWENALLTDSEKYIIIK